MVVANFSLQDKYNRDWLFEKTFLEANINVEVVSGMPFLFLSNEDFRSVEKELEWRKYTITKVLPIKKKIELVNCKEFAAIALNLPKKFL